jgi:hypothetical protein
MRGRSCAFAKCLFPPRGACRRRLRSGSFDGCQEEGREERSRETRQPAGRDGRRGRRSCGAATWLRWRRQRLASIGACAPRHGHPPNASCSRELAPAVDGRHAGLGRRDWCECGGESRLGQMAPAGDGQPSPGVEHRCNRETSSASSTKAIDRGHARRACVLLYCVLAAGVSSSDGPSCER